MATLLLLSDARTASSLSSSSFWLSTTLTLFWILLVSVQAQQQQSQQTRQQGNCVAGGAGYALSFDHCRADVVSLLWGSDEKTAVEVNAVDQDNIITSTLQQRQTLPTSNFTLEFYYKLTDPHLNIHTIFSYSVYK